MLYVDYLKYSQRIFVISPEMKPNLVKTLDLDLPGNCYTVNYPVPGHFFFEVVSR